jgi:hypothetical protein
MDSLHTDVADDVRRTIEIALTDSDSLTNAALTVRRGQEGRNLWRRATAFIRRHVHGTEAIDLFFKRGARCDIMLSAKFVCDPDDIADLIVSGKVPLIDATRGLPAERKLYQILYNRIGRRHGGDAPKQLKKQKRRKPSNFFKVSSHELGQAGR